MTVSSSSGLDLRWYSDKDCQLSKNPARTMAEFLQRLRKFDRNSVLIMSSLCTWLGWKRGVHNEELNKILTVYSHFVATIALAKCAPVGRVKITETSFRILVGEFFNIASSKIDSIEFEKNELQPLKKAIQYNLDKYDQLEKIDLDVDGHFLTVCLTFGRIAFIQWDGVSFSIEDLIRPYSIYKEFRELCIKENKCSAEQLNEAEVQYFGVEMKKFMKSIWVLFTQSNAEMDKREFPGGFDPKKPVVLEDTEKKLDITNIDVEKVAMNLSTKAEDFRSLLSGVDFENIQNTLHEDKLWILFKSPIVLLHMNENNSVYLTSSPWRLLRSVSARINYGFYDYLEKNSILRGRNTPFTFRGIAYEKYLYSALSEKGLRKAEELLDESYRGERCDFYKYSDETLLLIESKNRLIPNHDETFLHSRSLMASWGYILKAIKQASQTLKHLRNGNNKKVALIIVTEEALADQITQFLRAAKYWGFLDGSGIDCMAICPTLHLEHVISNKSVDDVYAGMEQVWNELDPQDINADIHCYETFGLKEKDDIDLKVLKDAWTELYKGLIPYP